MPSEQTTGSTRRLGAITKTGNGHGRRVLIEAAWNYRFPARVSLTLQIRQERQPAAIREIAWARPDAPQLPVEVALRRTDSTR